MGPTERLRTDIPNPCKILEHLGATLRCGPWQPVFHIALVVGMLYRDSRARSQSSDITDDLLPEDSASQAMGLHANLSRVTHATQVSKQSFVPAPLTSPRCFVNKVAFKPFITGGEEMSR